MSYMANKEEPDTPVKKDWKRVIDLSSECDCKACTVRRVVWPGIIKGLSHNSIKNEQGKPLSPSQWCEKRGRLPAGKGLKRAVGKGISHDVFSIGQREGAPVITNPLRKDTREYEDAIVEEDNAVPKAAVREVRGREGARSVAATREQAKLDKTSHLPRPKTEDDKSTIELEIKDERKQILDFMRTRAHIVTGLSRTNNELIRENGASHLARFLERKRSDTNNQADEGKDTKNKLHTKTGNISPQGQPGQSDNMAEQNDDAQLAQKLLSAMNSYPGSSRAGRHKVLVLKYTPGRDALKELTRHSFVRSYGSSVGSSRLFFLSPTASPSPANRPIGNFDPLSVTNQKRSGMPCANCNRTGVNIHSPGPTGCNLFTPCNQLWRANGAPSPRTYKGQQVIEPARDGRDPKLATSSPTAPISSRTFQDLSMKKNDTQGLPLMMPNEKPVVPSHPHPLAKSKFSSPSAAVTNNGNGVESAIVSHPPHKRGHGTTGLSTSDRPSKIPRTSHAVNSEPHRKPDAETIGGQKSAYGSSSKASTGGGDGKKSVATEGAAGGLTEEDGSSDEEDNHEKRDEKKKLKDALDSVSALCRRLFELEKKWKEGKENWKRSLKDVEDRTTRLSSSKDNMCRVRKELGIVEKSAADLRTWLSNYAGPRQKDYQDQVQGLERKEIKCSELRRRFLELSKVELDVEGVQKPEDKVKQYEEILRKTRAEIQQVKTELRKMTGREVRESSICQGICCVASRA